MRIFEGEDGQRCRNYIVIVKLLMLVTSGTRYLPLPVLGRAVGITGEDFEVAMKAWTVVNEAHAPLRHVYIYIYIHTHMVI